MRVYVAYRRAPARPGYNEWRCYRDATAYLWIAAFSLPEVTDRDGFVLATFVTDMAWSSRRLRAVAVAGRPILFDKLGGFNLLTREGFRHAGLHL